MKKSYLFGVLAAGVAVGFAISSLVQRDDKQEASNGQTASDLNSRGSEDEIAALRANYDRQIALLTSDNETLREQLSEKAGALPPSPPMTPSQQSAYISAVVKKFDDGRKQRATDMLLAAGYSMDRIEWLRNRSEELQKQRRQVETERLTRGVPVDPAKEMAYIYDHDIELRYEIGDDEYERYLRALDRPTSVNVVEVLPGSIADTIGIKPGDVIVDYDGKRLFNLGELDGLAMGKVGQSIVVNVKREGQLMQFVVPGGMIGVRSRNAAIDNSVRVGP